MGLSGAEWAGLALGGPIGLSVASGIRAQREQKKSLRAQEEAQKQAETIAQRQIRDNAEALARANRKQPNIASLLGDAQHNTGIGSTLLTGAFGVEPGTLKLGRSSLLGG